MYHTCLNSILAMGLGLLVLVTNVACSTTEKIPEGEKLYLGIKRIAYNQEEQQAAARSPRIKAQTDSSGVITAVAQAVTAVEQALNGATALDALTAMKGQKSPISEKEQRRTTRLRNKLAAQTLEKAKTEVEAVLAYAPNGALFGSSSMTTPWKTGLWLYNKYVDSPTKLGKWMFRTFAEAPILISNVSPQTRSLIATNTLRNHGFFRATAQHELVGSKDTAAAYIAYHLRTGPLFYLDSVAYVGFEALRNAWLSEGIGQGGLKRGEPFSTLRLTQERSRIEQLMRNNGYYYFLPTHVQYQADTIARPQQVQLRVLLDKTQPSQAKRPWYMGRTRVLFLNKAYGIYVQDSLVRGDHTYVFPKGRIPLLPHLWRYSIAHRYREPYRLSDQETTQNRLYAMGVFSSLEMEYSPRDSSENCDTLDLNIRVQMDKPYDAALEMYAHLKSNQQVGPGLSYEVAKHNAFRGAETLALKLLGSYEWQMGGMASNTQHNSFELGSELSLKIPRLLVPWLLPNALARQFKRQWEAHQAHTAQTGIHKNFVYVDPRPMMGATTFSLNLNWRNRARFFQLVNMGAAYAYKWYYKSLHQHELVLPRLEFNRIVHTTPTFDSIIVANPAVYASLRNQFVPSMAYTFTRQPRSSERNPLWLQFSIKEAGNLLSAAYAVAGSSFAQTDKSFLGVPFAQFIKTTAEMHYTYPLTSRFKLAMRLFGGMVFSYGNQISAPYAEQFYVGGANSVRGFSVRTVGPGAYLSPHSSYSYIDQTGDVKLEGNVELRTPLFGALHGAVFLDMGNVWLLRPDVLRPEAELSWRNLQRLAVGTGLGLRYDLQFIVLRFDLGIGLHAPYDTGRKGFYNLRRFRDGFALHFAIGYPF